MRKAELAALGIVLLMAVLAAAAYPYLPQDIASHWGLHGEINGYSPKWQTILLLPLLSFAILLLFIAIPRIDPLKENISKFRATFDTFILVFMMFFLYVFGLMIVANLGYAVNMGVALAPGLAALFYFIGVLLENSKRNWFIGMRTPWTLSNDRVWEGTNKAVGRIFRALSILNLVLFIFVDAWLIIFVGLVLSTAVFGFVYSYVLFKREPLAPRKPGASKRKG